MRRSRLPLSLVVGAAAVVLLVVSAPGQAPTRFRAVLDYFGPPPIEKGISPVTTRGPGTRESLRRRSIRLVSGPVDRAGRSGGRYIPGRVIVKFKDYVSSSSRLSALSVASRTASITTRPSNADFDIVQIDPAEDPETVAGMLAQRADVEYAQASYRMYSRLKPNDQYYADQWNLPIIGMERAWDIQPQAGSSITVAVIDTGMAFTTVTIQFHASAFRLDDDGFVEPPSGTGTLYPALGDLSLAFVPATQLITSGRIVAPHDFIWDDNLPVDLDGHGTHVSGTIGQLTNDRVGTAGVAFNVKLMPVKVLDGVWDDVFGAPNFGTDDVVARGIRYAVDNGAKILNMSLGRSGPTSPVIDSALTYAVGKGAFVAIAAGNDYEDGNPTEVPAESANRIAGVVSVAAIDKNKGHAYYSSSGPWVELAAPGGSFRGFDATGGILQQTLDLDLVETYIPPAQFGPPRFDVLAYFYFTGTSQATPHVSGVAAMLMQQGITDPAAIESALERTATDLGDAGRDPLFGFGLVQAATALRGLGLAR
jgi:serine protease